MLYIKDRVPSMSDALKILKKHQNYGDFYVDLEDLKKVNVMAKIKLMLMSKEIEKKFNFSLVPTPAGRADFFKHIGIPLSRLTFHGESSTGKDAINNLLSEPNNGLTKDQIWGLEIVKSYTATQWVENNWSGKWLERPVLSYPSCDMTPMIPMSTIWKALVTGRIGSYSPNILNIPREHKGVATVPYGYTLVRSDSSQIEPRIKASWLMRDEYLMDLIIKYEDAYFAILHAVLKWDHIHEKTEELNEMRQRLKKLLLSGEYNSKRIYTIDPQLAPLFAKYLENNIPRQEYVRKVSRQLDEGKEYFETAFGSIIVPEGGDKRFARGTKEWRDYLSNCAINNPLQGTAGDLARAALDNVDKLLGENCEKGFIMGLVYDEIIVAVKNQYVEELAPKIQGSMAYQVEGWVPITSDLQVGRSPAF